MGFGPGRRSGRSARERVTGNRRDGRGAGEPPRMARPSGPPRQENPARGRSELSGRTPLPVQCRAAGGREFVRTQYHSRTHQPRPPAGKSEKQQHTAGPSENRRLIAIDRIGLSLNLEGESVSRERSRWGSTGGNRQVLRVRSSGTYRRAHHPGRGHLVPSGCRRIQEPTVGATPTDGPASHAVSRPNPSVDPMPLRAHATTRARCRMGTRHGERRLEEADPSCGPGALGHTRRDEGSRSEGKRSGARPGRPAGDVDSIRVASRPPVPKTWDIRGSGARPLPPSARPEANIGSHRASVHGAPFQGRSALHHQISPNVPYSCDVHAAQWSARISASDPTPAPHPHAPSSTTPQTIPAWTMDARTFRLQRGGQPGPTTPLPNYPPACLP